MLLITARRLRTAALAVLGSLPVFAFSDFFGDGWKGVQSSFNGIRLSWAGLVLPYPFPVLFLPLILFLFLIFLRRSQHPPRLAPAAQENVVFFLDTGVEPVWVSAVILYMSKVTQFSTIDAVQTCYDDDKTNLKKTLILVPALEKSEATDDDAIAR